MTYTWEDAEAIRELLARYCYFLDGYRLDEFGNLFADDGEWTSVNGHATGPRAIEGLLRALMPVPTDGNRRKHFTANIAIRRADDAVEVTSNFLSVRNTAAGPAVVSVGTYQDLVVPTKDGWKFKLRRLIHEITGDVGLNKAKDPQ
jgi:3-phenylpropionate/cinnamic acid dioxygenase small subunit